MSFVDHMTWVGSVASTMVCGRELADSGAPEGATVIARAQHAGRGRRGRTWFSPEGGVYMTTLLRPRGPSIDELPQLALVSGLAIRRACEKLGATGVHVKWPNDVLLGARKLAGVLLETLPGPTVLVGVGLNLLARGRLTFEEADQAASHYAGLGDVIEEELSVHEVAHQLVALLEWYYGRWCQHRFAGLRAEFECFHALGGQDVSAVGKDGTINGSVLGVDDDGALRLATPAGTVRVSSGAVEKVRRQ